MFVPKLSNVNDEGVYLEHHVLCYHNLGILRVLWLVIYFLNHFDSEL